MSFNCMKNIGLGICIHTILYVHAMADTGGCNGSSKIF